MEMACYGRCFIITDRGLMGLVPPRAKTGDEIVPLPGGLYPFVIRKKEEEEGTYELIGDCFLYDFDAHKFSDEQSTEEIREFVLR